MPKLIFVKGDGHCCQIPSSSYRKPTNRWHYFVLRFLFFILIGPNSIALASDALIHGVKDSYRPTIWSRPKGELYNSRGENVYSIYSSIFQCPRPVFS